jgi:hypothetical protein
MAVNDQDHKQALHLRPTTVLTTDILPDRSISGGMWLIVPMVLVVLCVWCCLMLRLRPKSASLPCTPHAASRQLATSTFLAFCKHHSSTGVGLAKHCCRADMPYDLWEVMGHVTGAESQHF